MSAIPDVGGEQFFDSPGWIGSGNARAANTSLALYILLLATLAVVQALIVVRSLVRAARSVGRIPSKRNKSEMSFDLPVAAPNSDRRLRRIRPREDPATRLRPTVGKIGAGATAS
ncbi:hypothetical protein BH09PSE1_BH09PSE1_05210 [soil metagenome]